MTPADLAKRLAGWRFVTAPESALQAGLDAALNALGLAHEREARLNGRSRIDFMVGPEGAPRVGVEVKVHGAFVAVARQIQRYLAHDDVAGVLLVTTCARHTELPATLSGKPVAVLYLSPGAL